MIHLFSEYILTSPISYFGGSSHTLGFLHSFHKPRKVPPTSLTSALHVVDS